MRAYVYARAYRWAEFARRAHARVRDKKIKKRNRNSDFVLTAGRGSDRNDNHVDFAARCKPF